ncbi:MAG: hypothetical protein KJO95_07470 [Gammaproteobacteria bacterium]|nr:hypothetical protein [Gammaproteobacteria bacterium]
MTMSASKRFAAALLLLGTGWAIGYAQQSKPDFMLRIDAPAGETIVECVSGCEFTGARDLGNPDAGRMLVYNYGCRGDGVERCPGKVAGWVIR